jgi:hypothetical protein
MESKRSGRGRLVFMLWLLIAIIYFSLARNYISVSMDDREFEEYLQFAVDLVVRQGRSDEDLRSLIRAKARELELPLDPVNIEIRGEGQSIELRVLYSVNIQFPLLPEAGYQKEYEHELGYRTSN